MSYKKILSNYDIFVITDASIINKEVRGGISIFYKKEDEVHMLAHSFYLGYGSVSTNAEMKTLTKAIRLLRKIKNEDQFIPEKFQIDFTNDLKILVMNDNASAISILNKEVNFAAKSLYVERLKHEDAVQELRDSLDVELELTYVHAPREYNVISDKLSNYQGTRLFHKIIEGANDANPDNIGSTSEINIKEDE